MSLPDSNPPTVPTFPTHLHVLILQHPQEPSETLGTARLAHAALPHSTLKVGLSWPNLRHALGADADASRWAVLYLGSGIKLAPDTPKARAQSGDARQELCFVNKQGAPLTNGNAIFSELDGLVVLDGTWSQVKTLWWRNAWLLKLRRAILVPQRASLYGALRREPRRECLSTIESIALALTALGEPKTVSNGLIQVFTNFLANTTANRN